eukprot:TRINITY_DN3951_c0_g1_i3.p1 TRINITY_DN3951_c0_g1~~TRINITY_DN3951_c0_g1_i3.p1  ORF type:complete len:242 (-),score=54.23 TRINITY_DN3951_c0_g1_i3:78-803(-)
MAQVRFRHNVRKRHLDDASASEFLPDNKRFLSEKMAQDLHVLKLDDHTGIGTVFTPPPSPFHVSSHSTQAPFSSFSPQYYQQQHIQQRVQQLFNQQQKAALQNPTPSSPPSFSTSPFPTSFSSNSLFSAPSTPPQNIFTSSQSSKSLSANLFEALDEPEEEQNKKEDGMKIKVNVPLEPIVDPVLSFLMPPADNSSRALILYSAPSDIIQDSIKSNKDKKEQQQAVDKMETVATETDMMID